MRPVASRFIEDSPQVNCGIVYCVILSRWIRRSFVLLACSPGRTADAATSSLRFSSLKGIKGGSDVHSHWL